MKKSGKSLRNKLVKSFLIFILIPNISLSALMLCLSMYFIYENTTQMINGGNRTILDNLENTVETVSSLSNYPLLDPDIMEVLRKDYNEYGTAALFQKLTDAQNMQQILATQIFHMNPAIHSVFLFPENSEYFYYAMPNNSLDPNEDLRSTEWYQQILDTDGRIAIIGYHNLVGPGSSTACFSVGRCLIDSMNHNKLLGVLVINLSMEQMTRGWEENQFSEDGFTILIDENNRIISDEDTSLSDSDRQGLSAEFQDSDESTFVYYSSDKDQYFLSINSSKNSYGWRVATLIPFSQVFSPGAILLVVLMSAVILLLTTLIFLSNRTAARITRPIDHLKTTIHQVEHGDLSIQAEESEDEIGLLAKSFNHMTGRLRILICRIQQEEKEKHNAELLALQSQINPHFLYNTLNSIKFMAQIQGASSVSHTLDALVSFLRFCSKNSQEVISLREELQITEKYIEIMNMRYMDCIEYRVSVPDRLLDNVTIRFLLQPVIENAILHGFDSDLEERVILVHAVEQEDMVLIRIADNGKGMSEETIQRLLDKNFKKEQISTNIGLYNINQRIKFSFGAKYGLSIRSREKFYTVVEVQLPVLTKEEWEKHGSENNDRRG